jgi:23S rRNA (uracil1939-C5)-methyltransferase
MEKLLTHIKSLSHDGRGVASVAGKTTFIEGALAGETVAYQFTHRHKRYDEARVVDVIEPSLDRIEPLCKHFTICGGCSLQHVNPEEQIRSKQQTLLEQLTHFGGIEPRIVLPPLLGPIWGYRRKARLGVKFVFKKEKVIVGFREKNSRYLADLQQCEVLHPSVGYQLDKLSALIRNLSVYQHIAQLEVAIGEGAESDETNSATGGVETAYVIRHLQALPETDIATLIQFGKEHRVRLYLQSGGPETVSLLWPSDNSPLMKYTLPDHQIEILFSPMDFTQINLDINRKLVNLALELIEPTKNDHVLDLFCGLGNFTLPLARVVGKVTGVEGNQLMIERAKMNAQHNGINNATFFAD